MLPPSLLIVGASVRAAAQSALRAGLKPRSCDLFADRDLRATGASCRIEPADYPEGFQAFLSTDGGDEALAPWIYTGALENHPDLIDLMAAKRPLWGIAGDALRAVRDPATVASCLARRGLPAPSIREVADGLPRDGSWLVKPRASAGGRRIRPWTGGEQPIPSRPSYFQERIEGESLAALFVGRAQTAKLLGITLQILGRPNEPFVYAGSLGPWPVSLTAHRGIVALGEALAVGFDLRGIFGVDLILDRRDRPFPVEINPRYTASAEVLELAKGVPLMADHRQAFDPRWVRPTAPATRARGFVGKTIVFADGPSRHPGMDRWRPRPSALGSFAVAPVADIPAFGASFRDGEPVLTVLARGSTLESCRERLERKRDREWDRLIASQQTS